MALQLSVAVRNARLDQIEAIIGTAAVLRIFSGAVPANCAAADPAGLLIEITLPSDWMNAASGGTKTKLGTWSGSVTGAGTGLSFRLKDSTGATCGMQGTVSATGGGGDLTLDNAVLAVSQVVTINTFTLTDGNP